MNVCKNLVYDLLNDYRRVRVSFLEEQLCWQGFSTSEVQDAVSELLDQGSVLQSGIGYLEIVK
ncbi:MAG: hypothetical protein GF416_04245 [Candidatus Altiarchaeales archaeon]|nr:hypothetical protein [Candidatus Altiarchaeales archaeon]MBD3416331.1 hypothetical protein [Candidatus Altiarchaeales archaeon]